MARYAAKSVHAATARLLLLRHAWLHPPARRPSCRRLSSIAIVTPRARRVIIARRGMAVRHRHHWHIATTTIGAYVNHRHQSRARTSNATQYGSLGLLPGRFRDIAVEILVAEAMSECRLGRIRGFARHSKVWLSPGAAYGCRCYGYHKIEYHSCLLRGRIINKGQRTRGGIEEKKLLLGRSETMSLCALHSSHLSEQVGVVSQVGKPG